MSGSDEPVARGFVASGRVQGVFFRDSTRRRAEQLGLGGWIRNADDGSVEGVFEGPAAVIEKALEFVRGGPGEASVDHVEVTDAEPRGGGDFEIL